MFDLKHADTITQTIKNNHPTPSDGQTEWSAKCISKQHPNNLAETRTYTVQVEEHQKFVDSFQVIYGDKFQQVYDLNTNDRSYNTNMSKELLNHISRQ